MTNISPSDVLFEDYEIEELVYHIKYLEEQPSRQDRLHIFELILGGPSIWKEN